MIFPQDDLTPSSKRRRLNDVNPIVISPIEGASDESWVDVVGL